MPYVYRIPQRKKNYFGMFSVNSNLIFINLALFIIFSLLLSYNQNYIDYVAIKPSNIIGGNYLWTFLTSMFMHAGFFHLFANMVTLFFVGGLAQKILGQKRYFWFYLISGIVASLFFVILAFLFGIDLNVYAVGASGAIFGVIGFLMIITPNLPVYIMFIPIPVKLKYAAPGILIVLWLISIAGNVPIGNVAHLGGLIVGVAYGFYLRGKYKNKTRAISRHFS